MDNQLHWIIEFLKEKQISYWLDLGTLLKIYRDRKKYGDGDIDIGCFHSESEKILSLIPELEQHGYTAYIQKYRDMILKCFFHHPDLVPIDFKFFHLTDEWAWSPIFKQASNPFTQSQLNRYLLYQIGQLIEKTFWSSKKYQGIPFYPAKFPHSLFWISSAFVVPSHYFKELSSLEVEGVKIPIPSQTEDYLQFRYGNWEKPEDNWETWAQDGALTNLSLAQIENLNKNNQLINQVGQKPDNVRASRPPEKFELSDICQALIVNYSDHTVRRLINALEEKKISYQVFKKTELNPFSASHDHTGDSHVLLAVNSFFDPIPDHPNLLPISTSARDSYVFDRNLVRLDQEEWRWKAIRFMSRNLRNMAINWIPKIIRLKEKFFGWFKP